MKTLGIYFGPKAISLVETEGQKVLNNVLIPLQRLSGSGVEEKIPEESRLTLRIFRRACSLNRSRQRYVLNAIQI